MSSPVELARADLRDFGGYRSARSDRLVGEVWLNANEAPWPNPADADAVLRRYPDPQPDALRERLAALYGCQPAQLLAGRGSDEAIDLLVRAFCVPGDGRIVITSPTFGMYAVCARLHGARVVDVPLADGPDGWACDFEGVVAAARRSGARLVFLCSPGNPAGAALPLDAIAAAAKALDGQALVVVDEAYQEYATGPSATTLLDACRNLAVLRTLSKAHALAGARLGSVIADVEVIALLRRCQAPYPLPAPTTASALRALAAAELEDTQANVAAVVRERERVRSALEATSGVRRVYRSDANFLLVRFDDAQDAFERLLAAGVVVRDMRAAAGLADALRITVGRPQENDRVLGALSGVEAAA